MSKQLMWQPSKTPGAAFNALPNVQRDTLRERVLEAVRNAIIAGRLKPGEHIREEKVSRQLGVSRGPLREAISRLAEEGLVTTLPNRGSFVTELSAADAEEVYLVRGALEGLAAQLIAGKLSHVEGDELAALAGAIISAAERGELDAVAAADRRFHLRVIQLGRRPRIEKMWQSLQAQTVPIARRALDYGDPVEIAQHHLRVVEALRAGDGIRARRIVEEHIIAASSRAVEVLAQDRALP